MHVRLGEELVEPIFERDALATKSVWFDDRCKLLLKPLIGQASTDFVAPVVPRVSSTFKDAAKDVGSLESRCAYQKL